MKKVLLLSQTFDYSRMITYDAGPGYANAMQWDSAPLNQLAQPTEAIPIIDNRITEAECAWLEDYLQKNRDRPCFLKVVDPYTHCSSHWYYQFLFRVKDLSHVYFLSVYHPTELIQELDEATARQKLVWIPYPFIEPNQTQNPLKQRRNQIIFSGNCHPHLYPERSQFRGKYKRNPWLWLKVHYLQHPGYPDVGQTALHAITGEKYLERLAQFRFMFVSPSRCGLEFLKFSECARAGCVPIGQAPATFGPTFKEAFLPLDFDHLLGSIRRVFSMPISELQAIADRYYQAMSQERHPDLLNQKLDHFLSQITA